MCQFPLAEAETGIDMGNTNGVKGFKMYDCENFSFLNSPYLPKSRASQVNSAVINALQEAKKKKNLFLSLEMSIT